MREHYLKWIMSFFSSLIGQLETLLGHYDRVMQERIMRMERGGGRSVKLLCT